MSKKRDASISLLKKRFQEWYKNHPDIKFEATVYKVDNYFVGELPVHNISPLWFVVNLMGDLINWQETPTDWIEEIEEKSKRSNASQKTI